MRQVLRAEKPSGLAGAKLMFEKYEIEGRKAMPDVQYHVDMENICKAFGGVKACQ